MLEKESSALNTTPTTTPQTVTFPKITETQKYLPQIFFKGQD